MHRFNCCSLIKCFAAERSRCLWSICEANGVQWEIAIKDGTLPCWEKTEIRLLVASIYLKLFLPSSNLYDSVWWDPEIFVQKLVTAAWSWELFREYISRGQCYIFKGFKNTDEGINPKGILRVRYKFNQQNHNYENKYICCTNTAIKGPCTKKKNK